MSLENDNRCLRKRPHGVQMDRLTPGQDMVEFEISSFENIDSIIMMRVANNNWYVVFRVIQFSMLRIP